MPVLWFKKIVGKKNNVKKLWVQKNFGVWKKFGSKYNLGPKIIMGGKMCVRKKLGKKIGVRKYSGPKRFSPMKFWYKQMFVDKNLVKNIGQQRISPIDIFVWKKIDSKNLWS